MATKEERKILRSDPLGHIAVTNEDEKYLEDRQRRLAEASNRKEKKQIEDDTEIPSFARQPSSLRQHSLDWLLMDPNERNAGLGTFESVLADVDRILEFADVFDEEFGNYESIRLIGSFGVRSFYVVSVLVFSIFVWGLGEEFIMEFLCFAPPALMTTVQMHKGTVDPQFWISYWILFHFMNLLENLYDFDERLRIYHWFKFAFLFWCYYSATKGAKVFWSISRPLVDRLFPPKELD
ncbi:hypothetical protein AAMO2058_001354800 [Amorphochlora amoebiformis]